MMKPFLLRAREPTSALRGMLLAFTTVAISLLLCLLVLELVLRAYLAVVADRGQGGQIPDEILLLPNSERVYAPKPNLDLPVYTNSQGFRGPEFSIRKPAHTYRIIMLGDSITFGNNVSWNETFSSLLERRLNGRRQSRSYEVLNLGVSGYNTRQELATLREVGIHFSPDLVILNICLNDSDPAKIISRVGLINVTNIDTPHDFNLRTFMESSYALTFLKQNIAKAFQNNRYVLQMLHTPRLFIDPRVRESSWQKMKNDMLELFETTRTHGIPMAVVIYPYASQIDQNEAERLPQQDLIRFWQQRGVPVIDAVPAYRDAEQDMFVDGVLHLSAYGHQRIAEKIHLWLYETRILPESR